MTSVRGISLFIRADRGPAVLTPVRFNLADAGLIALAVGTYIFGGDYLFLATSVLSMVILVVSLDLATGYAGIDTLGHSAFFGTGAYAAGLYALHLSTEPISGIFVGALAAALVAFLSGLLVLRSRGLTLVMLTLAVASALHEFANLAKGLTGGADGLAGYSIAPVLGLFRFDLFGRTAFIYSLAVFAVVFVFCRILVSSPFGLTIRGIKENPQRMRLLGVPVLRRLVTMYAISAAIAGVAGALTAQITDLVGLDSLGFILSGNALIMLVLGGTGRLYGAVFGAIVFVVFSDRAAAIDPVNWLFGLGIVLILAVRFAPNGLIGAMQLVAARLQKHA
jgi:branched-chain amino acid transport system permease protein